MSHAEFDVTSSLVDRVDPLVFWRRACLSTQPGEVLTLPGSALGWSGWRSVAALAPRMGFHPIDPEGLRWENRRHTDSPVLGWVGPDDLKAWQRLFRTCFGHDMAETQWRWKYREADHPGIGLWLQGELVAFYGGMPRPVWALGQRRMAIQVGDVMVHPDHRGGLSRQGPFQMVAATFLEQRLAQDAPFWIGFGFPNRRAMQVARRLKLYRPVDDVLEIHWSTTRMSARLARGVAWNLTDDDRLADRHWPTMLKHLGPSATLGERDAAYVRSRYLEHPGVRYTLLHVTRWWGLQSLGLVIMRRHEDGRAEIMDLIGDPAQALPMVASACQWAAAEGVTQVFMWLTQSQLPRLDITSPEVAPLGVQVPTNDWIEGANQVNQAKPWWLTGGDTDFR